MISNTTTLALLVAATNAAGYSFAQNGADWPTTYPLCGTGKEQSPIDLTSGTANDKLKLTPTGYYDFKATTTEIDGVRWASNAADAIQKETGRAAWHTNLPLPTQRAAANLQITGADGSITGDYTPIQFHFHAPSEHTVDGKYYDAEMHFVHTVKGSDTTYGAVIGVFFDKVEGGATDNPFLTTFFDSIGSADTAAADAKAAIAVNDFLASIDATAFYSYNGSFTTPPCTEGIKWSVMKKVQPISEAQLTKFTERLAGNTKFAAG